MWTIKYHKPNFEMPSNAVNFVTSTQGTYTYMLAHTQCLSY